MDLQLPRWTNWYKSHQGTILEDFFHFLRFRSISTDAAYDQEIQACTDWLSHYLNQLGLSVEKWETSGHPCLLASHCKAEGRPTLLLYHHYDVQPCDPLESWESPPFEPRLRDGNVYARGAQDNKGQCFYTITAIKALLSFVDHLNFNLKVLIEGEEEIGSGGLAGLLEAKALELKSDYLLVVDVNLIDEKTPTLTMGLRGLLTMEVLCKAADIDTHSGSLGGIAYNPIRALVSSLGACWDVDGKISVVDFYRDVRDLSLKEKNDYFFEVDKAKVKRDFGLRLFGPEPGYTIGESVAIRPTFEINGISGGYTQEGFKTVIPALARAKISCRLVPDQDPKQIARNLEIFLRKQMPKGIEVQIDLGHVSAPFRTRPDSPIAFVVARAYEEVMDTPCKKVFAGGSIPIVGGLARVSGADTLVMGFGLDSDQPHAPNEHFGLDRFEMGFLTMGRIMSMLNEQK